MKKTTLIMFRIISLIIIIICLIFIYRWYKSNVINKEIQEEVGEFIDVEDVSDEDLDAQKLIINFKELKEINPETVGWVRVNNTNIDFPIVQHSDNTYYLKHNFYNEWNNSGWIFADSENSFETLDKNTIIYGHNMKNGEMFENLSYLLNDSWNFEKENLYFSFATEKKSYKAEIFSVYMKKATQLQIPSEFEDNEEFQEYIEEIKNSSIHDFDIDINKKDEIITLCTCGDTSKNRIVVHAKLIEL